MEPQRVCSKCGIYETYVWNPLWVKCCPDHTPENEALYVCEFCAMELHPKNDFGPTLLIELL